MTRNTESEIICETCIWMELVPKDAPKTPCKYKYICRNDDKKFEISGIKSKVGELRVSGETHCKLYESKSE